MSLCIFYVVLFQFALLRIFYSPAFAVLGFSSLLHFLYVCIVLSTYIWVKWRYGQEKETSGFGVGAKQEKNRGKRIKEDRGKWKEERRKSCAKKKGNMERGKKTGR